MAMPKEIERKFLVTGWSRGNPMWLPCTKGIRYQQGYLTQISNLKSQISNQKSQCLVRIRVGASKAYITIKSANIGCTRTEYEFPIPLKEAKKIMADLCSKVVNKIRYLFKSKGHTWEIDEFLGANKGLVIAEIELKSVREKFAKPEWIGAEVTGDARYYSCNLIDNPYKNWKHRETK